MTTEEKLQLLREAIASSSNEQLKVNIWRISSVERNKGFLDGALTGIMFILSVEALVVLAVCAYKAF